MIHLFSEPTVTPTIKPSGTVFDSSFSSYANTKPSRIM